MKRPASYLFIGATVLAAGILSSVAQAASAAPATTPAASVGTGVDTGSITTGTTTPTTNKTAQEMEPIIVTGSAIPTTDAEGPSEVQVINSETIKQRGYTTVADILRNTPASGGVSDAGLDANGFTPGAAFASLRGLGPQATLVLVNGRRVACGQRPIRLRRSRRHPRANC
jgi:iron complex outermembrane receptor protein